MSIFTRRGELHLKDYLDVLKRRWRLSAVTFVSCVLGAMIYIFTVLPTFQATATLVVNPDLQQSILGPINAYVAEMNEDLSILTQLNIIRSDPISEGVVRRLKLADEVKDPQAFQDFVRRVKSAISVERISGTRLFKVSAFSSKGQEAADVANAAAEVFIEQSMQSRFDASRKSIAWLTEQIIQVRERLQDAEQTLLKYEHEGKFDPINSSTDFQTQKLDDLQSQYLEVQSRNTELKAQLQQVREVLQDKKIRFVPESISSSLDALSKELAVAELAVEKTKIELKEKHPKVVRMREELTIIEDQIRNELKKSIKSLESEYQGNMAREKILQGALNELNKSALQADEKQIKLNILKREVETYKELYNILIKKLKEADLTRGVGESNFRIIEYAQHPREPIRPKRRRNLFFGVVVGAVLGIGMTYMAEYFDRTIRTPDEIEEALDLPVLVSIPKSEGKSADGERAGDILFKENMQSPEAVSFHALRTNLRFSQPQGKSSLILVTSSSPSEGKTTITANLGISFAMSGLKTLIVDTDLRKPRMHDIFSVGKDNGVSNSDENTVLSHIKKTAFKNLDVLPCGPRCEAPFELLESDQMIRIIAKLKTAYDQIIFDSPPVGSVVDASILATYVDGVVFVLHSGKVDIQFVKHAKEQLEKVRGKIIGVVLNRLDRERLNYYSYYYQGYYGDKAKEIVKDIRNAARKP